MKVAAAAVAVIATLSTSTLAQDECVSGSFILEFDGTCTADAVVATYEDQVFNSAGAKDSSCVLDAAADLTAKVVRAGLADLEALCDLVYASQDKVPFTDAAKRGTDLLFEKMFFNGRTDWQEEVETIHETDDLTRTSILKEDAEQVRVFYDGIAQGRRVEWPGSLSNFQSSVTDTDGKATCTTNAAMCCWPKDRQANDNNGNCAKEYDQNCVDKDPADNTNLCFVDLERGNKSTGFDSTDIIVYPGDNSQGEGSIHCHGLAWSNDVNDHTARYKANNLFYVSMYDHMYKRGYVENIPGAPMCGCVEQMPTVSRSDCTQVDLTESIEITYHADTNTFHSKLASVYVDFNACKGIDNRNNDLWAYMARLWAEGAITSRQFGEAGRIITNTGCHETIKYALNEKSLTPGYDHDILVWTNVAGRESMKLNDGYGHRALNKSLRPEIDNTINPHFGIIFRACQSCIRTHMKIYYRRRTPVPDDFSLIDNILYRENNGGGSNVWGVDFSLHSSLEDSLQDKDPWLCPNNSFNYAATFYGECSPDGSRVRDQRSKFQNWNDKNDVGYFVLKPEDEILEIVHTEAIKGRDWAGGVALRDPVDGAIYMTGSGRDIWGWGDDFNFMAAPAGGDHTLIVHVGDISSPDPHGWSKSGLMFRSTLEPNSANYGLYLTGGNGVAFQGRLNSGDHPSGFGTVNAGATSAWLKIEKRMDTYTSFTGTQEGDNGPITWTKIHSREIKGIGESYYVGLAVSSARWLSQEVVFRGYQSDSYYFPSAAPSVSGAPTMFVPSLNIGAVGITGSASLSPGGSYVVKASGSDIWGGSDQFLFVQFEKQGNVEAELFVTIFDGTHSWRKGGLMIRETLDPNSKHFSLFMTGNNGIANQFRETIGGSSGNSHNSGLQAKPVWLQVTKVANQFSTAYKYAPDDAWMQLWSRSIDFTSESFFVGIAVTSHNNNELATFHASDLSIVDLATPEPTMNPTTSPTVLAPTPPARKLRMGA